MSLASTAGELREIAKDVQYKRHLNDNVVQQLNAMATELEEYDKK